MGLWNWPWQAGNSGFGSSSTAEQVTEGIDASHLTAIITGATNGIGKETARVLALRGAKVIIPSRTLESGMKTKESLLEQNPDAKLQVMEMDLSSLDSVQSFARSFNSSNKQLNILINNAGIMACPFQLSKDGIELQFATNHLGHFLLTKLLLEKMKDTARKTGIQGRIVNVSSIAHRRSDGSCFDLDKINDKSQYKPFRAYSHSKLANILHANELSRQLKDHHSGKLIGAGEQKEGLYLFRNIPDAWALSTASSGGGSADQGLWHRRLGYPSEKIEEGSNVTANSLHPGVIFTNITRYLNINGVISSLATVAPFIKGIPQGAATNCYLALHPDLTNVTGKYFVNCNDATPSAKAGDEALAKKLWKFSEELIKRN